MFLLFLLKKDNIILYDYKDNYKTIKIIVVETLIKLLNY
jgi:hypothetical protein